MKKLISVACVAMAMLGLTAAPSQAQPPQDCLVEGTVNKARDADGDKVYVAFHSAKRYDKGAGCRLNRNEQKVRFRQPGTSAISEAPEGATVRYRYRQDPEQGSSWELIDISES